MVGFSGPSLKSPEMQDVGLDGTGSLDLDPQSIQAFSDPGRELCFLLFRLGRKCHRPCHELDVVIFRQ